MEIQITAAVSYGPVIPSRGPRDIPSHYLMPEKPFISSVQAQPDLPASWAYKEWDLATRLGGRGGEGEGKGIFSLLQHSLLF